MTNTVALVTVILTNWVSVPGGDYLRESGTNYVKQRMVLTTNLYAEEVVLCTNRFLIKQESNGTNGPIKWRPQPVSVLPPLPGQRTKE